MSPRRRSIIRFNSGLSGRGEEKAAASVVILHVEDNRLVADAVRDTLKQEGWSVELCSDGEAALRKLGSDALYDVLLFDYDLPGVSGLELVRRARRLEHRRETPIIMLSAVNCAKQALSAGANVFLRKPEDVLLLAETISRLLQVKSRQR